MIKKLILASCSPRRRELIKFLGYDHQCISVDTDEISTSKDPGIAACEISLQKAEACLTKFGGKIDNGELIIGADTTVVLGNETLGKPKDRDDAYRMLSELSDNVHSVYTGVSFIYMDNGLIKKHSFFAKTDVRVAKLSANDIIFYLDIGEYKDKAGAYAIQGIFSQFISEIHGEYNNVVGFPVARIREELEKI